MHGEYKIPGGKLVVVDLAVAQDALSDVQVSGDFFIEPDTALAAINQALEGLTADSSAAHLTAAVQAALGPDVQLYGLTADGVAVAVLRALGRQEQV